VYTIKFVSFSTSLRNLDSNEGMKQKISPQPFSTFFYTLGGGDGAALREVLTYNPSMVIMIEVRSCDHVIGSCDHTDRQDGDGCSEASHEECVW